MDPANGTGVAQADRAPIAVPEIVKPVQQAVARVIQNQHMPLKDLGFRAARQLRRLLLWRVRLLGLVIGPAARNQSRDLGADRTRAAGAGRRQRADRAQEHRAQCAGRERFPAP